MFYIWGLNIDSFIFVVYLCIIGKYFSLCWIDINL